MFDLLQSLMQKRSDLLAAGRLAELAENYLYPYPLYMGGNQQVVRDGAEMEALLRRVQGKLIAKGVTRVTARVMAVELPRQGRFRVWMTHLAQDGAGLCQSRTACLHYCFKTDTGIKTEMADYLDCGFGWLTGETRRVRA